MAETYLNDAEYDERVAFLLSVAPLLNIAPCPFTGHITDNEIKIAMGLRCDIWPARIIEAMDPEDRPAPKKSRKQ